MAGDAESTTSGRCCIRSVLAVSMDRVSQPAMTCTVVTALHGEPVWPCKESRSRAEEPGIPTLHGASHAPGRRGLEGYKGHDGRCAGTAGSTWGMDEGDRCEEHAYLATLRYRARRPHNLDVRAMEFQRICCRIRKLVSYSLDRRYSFGGCQAEIEKHKSQPPL